MRSKLTPMTLTSYCGKASYLQMLMKNLFLLERLANLFELYTGRH
jgi:hypothetical protein